jgi:hypothetical protein
MMPGCLKISTSLRDFLCWYIIIDEIWVPLAESLLITMYAPVWNQAVEGFGIKTPGKGREKQRRSEWDVLHAGRGFAVNLATAKKTEAELREQVKHHIDSFLMQRAGQVSENLEFKAKEPPAISEEGEVHNPDQGIDDDEKL